MGCCHANSQPYPLLLEEHEKAKEVKLKRESAGPNSLIMVEHYSYYEKNPSGNGKYTIKRREIQKSVPILRSVSESKLITRRLITEVNTKESESDKSNEDKTTIVRPDSLD